MLRNPFLKEIEQWNHKIELLEFLKFLTLRYSSTGSAPLLLGRTRLFKEFSHTVTRHEIYNILLQRKKKPDESVYQYIMEKESIVLRSDINDFELVAFIQEGIQGRV